ncbi:UNKNOWN [Stylonychia lemnae]|uniref:Polynucleotide 5'-hydroxyl-kinase NOL9 n=1 Tax=Stylonychia lemnae TaxID=5949 RepID=A0A078AMH0_STYLE|nr:UNKNOWN [Stylonychia lemnae]|eukprot:CDW82587.1 UNKNOWN [Stylonychia lemnae]
MDIDNLEGVKIIRLFPGKSFRFAGALRVKVLQGQVEIYGVNIINKAEWHSVFSDPRKNMLLSINNISQNKEVRNFKDKLDGNLIKIKEIKQGESVIAIQALKDYTLAEQQFLLTSNEELNIANISLDDYQSKSFFNLNNSWRQSFELLVKISKKQQLVILVNGIQNSGKSTYVTALINQLKSLTSNKTYLLDIDPGQPIFTLAGALSLIEVNGLNLNNIQTCEHKVISSYFTNSSSPSGNMRYYHECCKSLIKTYDNIIKTQSANEQSVLLINTPGWVEGLGADILLKATSIIQPKIVVTMTKKDQGLKDNDYIEQAKIAFDQLMYVTVENDINEGAINTKGSVQRNRRLISSLIAQSYNKPYLFKQNTLEGSNQLPLQAQNNKVNGDDYFLSKTHAFVMNKQVSQLISFTDVKLASSDLQFNSKIEILRQFNGQIVAGIQLDEELDQSQLEDLKLVQIDLKEMKIQPLNLSFFGIVKDIDYNKGMHVISQNDVDIKCCKFNTVMIVNENVFKVPQSYLVQDDLIEIMICNQVNSQIKSLFYGKNYSDIQYLMPDFITVKK